MKTISIGSEIPDFELRDQDGEMFDINQVKGKKNLVIYFYPKDETAGCTREACAFRDSYEDFGSLGAEVIGISGDGVKSHSSFSKRLKLPFTLLSDPDNNVRTMFGVPRNLFLIPGRVTYIVDKKGVVRYIFNSQSQIDRHISSALKILNDLKNQ